MERFLEYWQAGKLQQLLHDLLPEQVQTFWQTIPEQGTMVVVPFYAKHADQYFLPCLLLVDINAQGKYIAKPHLSLPIIPRINLEPSPLNPITLGLAENFANYMAINPPVWLDEPVLLSWGKQLAYAQEMFANVNSTWREDLLQLGYTIHDDALLFPLDKLLAANDQSLQNVSFVLLDNPNKITLIDAERNSGTTKHAKQLIINAWIQAAVKQLEPPQYVWLQPKQPVNYATIFACLGSGSAVHTLEDLHPKLVAEYDVYTNGNQVIRNWQDMRNRVREKYADKGGIEVRLNQLRASAKDAKVQSRHIQVLHSIWQRQKELLVAWYKVLDFVPTLQRQRLHRLHIFFKQNFPQENVAGFTETQFDELLTEKLRRAENNERMIGDALHQVENDLHQEDLVKEKCLQWCQAQNISGEDVEEIRDFLETRLWGNLARTAMLYWQQDFAAKQGYANFLTKQPEAIELLIVEHAEYIDPIQAIELLGISKRAVVMGNYNPICNPRFPVQIDYELTKYFGLVENDADFEDLQFDGVLASVGNMWNLVAKDRDADQIFTRIDNENLQYEFVDVRSHSEAYLGSMINRGVISAVEDWLNKHAAYRSEIVIYTCFAGQQQLLQTALQATLFAQVPIKFMQEPCFSKSAISIFVPIYSATDPGPYVFDRGSEMFDQLLANTTTRVVVIGDKRIFKPHLHSATGNFAKYLIIEEASLV